MKTSFRKLLVIGTIVLFLGAGITSVYAITIKNEQPKPLGPLNTITYYTDTPTQDGTWVITVVHKGTYNGAPYEGAWRFSIQTSPNMTAAEKADAMRAKINGTDCPISAGGTGTNVQVSSDNGQIVSSTSKSDDGQSIHASGSNNSAVSFVGVPSTGSVSVDVDGKIATTSTDGKQLPLIHYELWNQLNSQGANVLLDPSGLAIYIFNIVDICGLDSNDDELSALGVFLQDLTIEPFNVYVSMNENVVASPGSTITAEFIVDNYRFVQDDYQVTVTDDLGWEISPNNTAIFLGPGENQIVELSITVPPPNFGPTNVINVTATSLSAPWMKSSGYLWAYVNNHPETPIINGTTHGKPLVEYNFTLSSIDPDGDNLFYIIDWNDDTPEQTIGPYPAGQVITVNHTWAEKGTFVIRVKAMDDYGAQSNWATFEIKMPRGRGSAGSFLQKILERFPNAFPIIRHLVGA